MGPGSHTDLVCGQGLKSSSSMLSLNDTTEGISSSSIENKDNCLSPMSQNLFDNCCTTECDPAQDMILPSTNETEIF